MLTGWAGEPPFLMAVEDVFSITGRGTVVTGRVERGSIKKGQAVDLVGLSKDARTEVVAIESFRKQLDQAEAGKTYGILLKGLTRDQIVRGQVLARPDSIQAHSVFTANTAWLAKEQGGKSKAVTADYRPYCRFRTASVSGELVDLADSVQPGGEARLKFRLQEPVALELGQIFIISEGSRTVANGTVTGFP
ncbi:MAG: hypothetical protein KF760_23495 [Candidatus Eremiobacteraeota bacterium]|nr:hypothetical protein [Candidatus Eremiobacteraeota bacterium]